MTSLTANYQATLKAAKETFGRFEESGLLTESIRAAVSIYLKGMEARLLDELTDQVRNRDKMIGTLQAAAVDAQKVAANAMKRADEAEARLEAKDNEIRRLNSVIASMKQAQPKRPSWRCPGCGVGQDMDIASCDFCGELRP